MADYDRLALEELMDPAQMRRGGGIQAPVDPTKTPIEVGGGPPQTWQDAAVSQTTQVREPATKKSLQDILGGYGYGAKSLIDAEKELGQYGYEIQKDSAGLARGRVRGADGTIYDVFDPREGRTADNNWNTNPIEGGQWTINNLGNQTDAGGWSFGGGGGMSSPLVSAGAAPGSARSLIEGITDESTYQKMLAKLQGILGPGNADHDALMALMGGQ